MLGAIAGDIVGSVYEAAPTKSVDFPLFSISSRFTDDTVLTVAVAHAILEGRDYAHALRKFGRRYPNAGYGSSFIQWLQRQDLGPYDSWGNGAAMRVSPVGFAFDNIDQVLHEARRSAAVSHSHSEGIKGAQATALAILLARQGESKDAICSEISDRFGYSLDRSLDEIRPDYRFDVSCQGSVPESIIAFLESHDLEDAIRKAISLGGDSDTMACIAGGIAEAYYKEVPAAIQTGVFERLPYDLAQIVKRFYRVYGASI